MRIPPNSLSTQLPTRRPLPPTTNDSTRPTISVRRHLPTPAPTPPDIGAGRPTEAGPTNPITQEGFNKAWGSDNADYDLNGDGVVDVQDLIQFIANGDTTSPGSPGEPPVEKPVGDVAAPVSPSTAPAPPSTEVQPEPVAEPDAPLTLEGFMKAWGSDDAGYDINGDGSVNVQDLVEFMLDYPGQGEEASAGTVGRIDATRVDRLDKLADHLIGRLEPGGFNQPPNRLAAVLSKLPIAPAEQKHVLSRVLSAYPPGRSLDVTG